MGCDIHMYVEYKRTINSTSQWIPGDFFSINPYAGEDGEPALDRVRLYSNRNYALFATLAGVRDYSGEITPVSEPRGLPHDVCNYIREECEKWGTDGHTHSWLSLSDLKEFQKNAPDLHYPGMISPEDQNNLDNGILPSMWCQGTTNESWVHRTWTAPNNILEPIITALTERGRHSLWPYSDPTPQDEHNIRIVFWFDN